MNFYKKRYKLQGQYVKILLVIDMKKYEMIYSKYRDDILNGYLKTKQFLPSIRESCDIFKTSQTTVEHAYNKLLDEGYISSIPAVGYFVSIEKERIHLHKQLDQYSKDNKKIEYKYDFRSQTVSFDNFEVQTWKRYLRDVLDDMNNMSTYGDSQGEYVLREALSGYAYKVRGVLGHPDHILVSSNYQSLLFVLCGLFEKDIVIGMENHDHEQAKRVFESYGFRVVVIDSDNQGISMSSLKKVDIDVLYLNTASGGYLRKPISNKLRDEVISYCSDYNILIIEDDYNGELSYVSKSHHALQGFALKDNVIYCGSFSRLLLPSLRISYMVLNEKYYQIYLKHKHQYGPTASKLEQLAFSRYIVDGYLEKHLRKLKKEYKEKHRVMLKSIKKHIPYSFYLNEAYLSYTLQLHHIDEEKLIKKCNDNNIAISHIKNHELKISFASLSLDKIEEAIIELSFLLKQSETF